MTQRPGAFILESDFAWIDGCASQKKVYNAHNLLLSLPLVFPERFLIVHPF